MKSKEEKQNIIGERLFRLFPFWETDAENPAELTEQVKNNPEDVILYLLDYIENN